MNTSKGMTPEERERWNALSLQQQREAVAELRAFVAGLIAGRILEAQTVTTGYTVQREDVQWKPSEDGTWPAALLS